MEKNSTERKKFSFRNDIMGGQFLSRNFISGQWRFILYVFGLLVLYISLSLNVDRTQIEIRKNQGELKNLKADYTAKAARLQYLSKRNEVESRLLKQGSPLAKPADPARRVKLIEKH